MTDNPTREEMLKVFKYIEDFVQNMDCGESFWVAPNGERFSADVGYGLQFLDEIIDYLRREYK